MKLLALESSCDETSAAVIEDGYIVSNIISSQIELHAQYGGVVPELATREHLRNVPIVVREALNKASIKPSDLDCVAATRGPGLPGALMTGLRAGQSMARALKIPFMGIHHHEAHLYSAWINENKISLDDFKPSIGLIVSGGHTLLVLVEEPLRHRVLGGTLDDAAGECFDKTAKLLGLKYPGGPLMDKLAQRGNPQTYSFPRPMLHDKSYDFSFSGLKTAVRYFLEENPKLIEEDQFLYDICASVQAAIVEVLVGKVIQAAKNLKVSCITMAGGVSANSQLRAALSKACKVRNCQLKVATGPLCADNAGMIGALAWLKFSQGLSSDSLDEDPKPHWDLPENFANINKRSF